MNDLSIEQVDFANDIGKFISAYMNDESILSAAEKKVYIRLIDINDNLKNMQYKTSKDLLEYHKKKFDITLAQARRDMEKAISVFNKIELIDPSTILRLTLYQTDYFLNLCKEKKDTKNASKFLEMRLKLVDLILKNTVLNPQEMLPNTYLFFTGKEAKKEMNLDTYDNAEVIEFIERLNIEKEEKKRLKNEVKQLEND
jgi:hypothetical protein